MGEEGTGVTDRRDGQDENHRTEQEAEDDLRRQEETERRRDELREAWRRRHPSQPDEAKRWPRKESRQGERATS